MKDEPRIYVIYFLIGGKMKKIVFLFFTFSGICPAFSQKSAEMVIPDSLIKSKNDTVPEKEKQTVRLFPNPARNKVEIEINGFQPGFIQVQLIDNTGNLVRNDKRLLFSGNEIIVVMFLLQPGLYLLVLKQNEKFFKRKLIVQ